MKIGIDNYSLHPLKLTPLETLQWAIDNNADGVQFSGLEPDMQAIIDDAYLKDLSQLAKENNMYLEWGGGQHIPRDMNSWSKKEIFRNNEFIAGEAELVDTRIIRSCSGGLMRWKNDSPPAETLLKETAEELRRQKQMLKDHNVILAIETHFEFTTYELLRLFDICGAEPGEYLGICLDSLNLLTILEEPIEAVKRILPWVVSSHIKDGGIIIDREGMRTFPTPTGKGIIDFSKIISLFNKMNREFNLSIEDHGGYIFLPIYDPLFMSKFPDLTVQEITNLIKLSQLTDEKLKAHDISIVDRADWESVCEARLAEDIRELKIIAESNY